MIVPFIYSHETQEQIDARERRKADESNKSWFPHIFAKISNELSKSWYVISIPWLYGGNIHCVYKKYPNVYMLLDFNYDSINAQRNKFVSEFKFYIDENHWSNITVSDIDLLSYPERIEQLIEMTIGNYCKSNIREKIQYLDNAHLTNHLLVNTGQEYKLFSMDDIKDYKFDRDGNVMMWKLVDNYNDGDGGTISSTMTHYMTEFSDTTRFLINVIKLRETEPYVEMTVPEYKAPGVINIFPTPKEFLIACIVTFGLLFLIICLISN